MRVLLLSLEIEANSVTALRTRDLRKSTQTGYLTSEVDSLGAVIRES